MVDTSIDETVRAVDTVFEQGLPQERRVRSEEPFYVLGRRGSGEYTLPGMPYNLSLRKEGGRIVPLQPEELY